MLKKIWRTSRQLVKKFELLSTIKDRKKKNVVTGLTNGTDNN